MWFSCNIYHGTRDRPRITSSQKLSKLQSCFHTRIYHDNSKLIPSCDNELIRVRAQENLTEQRAECMFLMPRVCL